MLIIYIYTLKFYSTLGMSYTDKTQDRNIIINLSKSLFTWASTAGQRPIPIYSSNFAINKYEVSGLLIPDRPDVLI